MNITNVMHEFFRARRISGAHRSQCRQLLRSNRNPLLGVAECLFPTDGSLSVFFLKFFFFFDIEEWPSSIHKQLSKNYIIPGPRGAQGGRPLGLISMDGSLSCSSIPAHSLLLSTLPSSTATTVEPVQIRFKKEGFSYVIW